MREDIWRFWRIKERKKHEFLIFLDVSGLICKPTTLFENDKVTNSNFY